MKILFSVSFGLLFSLAMVSTAVVAQDNLPKTVNGGVLNGKAASLPKPEYPEAARQAKIGGMVGVNVTIDESGTIIFAEADLYDQRERKNEDGTMLEPVLVDQSLREAAEKAAYLAKFSPTRLSGQLIRVKGKIVYNFVADNSDQAPRVGEIHGSQLNGKATSLPAPAYPAAARAVNAQGAVTVQVTVDETGNVVSATAISGHPLLRAASETAAQGAKFSPTLMAGQPVKFTGVLTYNFVAPKKEDK